MQSGTCTDGKFQCGGKSYDCKIPETCGECRYNVCLPQLVTPEVNNKLQRRDARMHTTSRHCKTDYLSYI